MKIIKWLVYSSANEEKYSRTLKAGLVALAPTISILLMYAFGLQVTQESLLIVIGNVVEAFGALMTLVFMIAKIVNTVSSWKKV